ncbi:MAG: NAD(P)-binding domain-containing protein [Thiobacillaceae bacterium]
MAMIGLDKMGGSMMRRLCRHDTEVIAHGCAGGVVDEPAREDRMVPAVSVRNGVSQRPCPRIVWLMLPSAEPTAQPLHELAPVVPDSGQGGWSCMEAIGQGAAAPVLSFALNMRFNSQDKLSDGFRLLSLMLNGIAGHGMEKAA